MDADSKCLASVMVLVTVVLVLVRVSAAGTTRTCRSAVPRRMPAGTLKLPDVPVCALLSSRQVVSGACEPVDHTAGLDRQPGCRSGPLSWNRIAACQYR